MPEASYPSAVFAGLAFAVQGLWVDSLLSYPVYLADCLCYPIYPDFGLVYLAFFGGLDSDYPVDSYRLCYPDFGLVGCRYSADYLSTFVLPEHNYTLFRRHTDYFCVHFYLLQLLAGSFFVSCKYFPAYAKSVVFFLC